ncbi:topology modulation protein [Bradyrhizobium sp. HKCCYLS20291]|uniref:topology modulation protein n=1 Tax=Bradyrhizobium sp. HKCCYLS20291 TaxID=3420766 RepID=UPI003EB6EE4F
MTKELSVRTGHAQRANVRGLMEPPPISGPSRILVLGASGAGKSTLSRAIGSRVGLPVVHLDALYWTPGWVASDAASFRAKVATAAAGDAWVMDGNYSSSLDLRLPRAEVVIWLDLPRRIYFPRAVWWTLRGYGRPRADVGEGNPERFDWSFFRNWVWTYPSRRPGQAKLMAQLPPGLHGITLRSPADVRKFVAGLPQSLVVGASDCGNTLDKLSALSR